MKINYQFADPEQVQVTISATMTVAEWRVVAGKLLHNRESDKSPLYPFTNLGDTILEAISLSIAKAEIRGGRQDEINF